MNSDWIDAKSACALLGVKPQTLYAYVSRHRIRTQADPADTRTSLYARQDIEALRAHARRPRARGEVAQAAIRWGDPILPTAISEVRDGTVWLRGRQIEVCAQTMTLEEVAAWLCRGTPGDCPNPLTTVMGETPFARAMVALADAAAGADPMLGRAAKDIAGETGGMLARVADACLRRKGSGPIHRRVAAAWALSPEAEDAVRQALVLLSDHELNPSTFAVRVCAATGASLPAALLAGMATLSGPRHGGVAAQTLRVINARMQGGHTVLSRLEPYGCGFGHPLYPQGDPRATYLLGLLPKASAYRQAIEGLAEEFGQPPNVDAGLVALGLHFGFPDDAAGSIFAMGRTAGWIAHAIEQVQSGAVIRPRARFQPDG
ncbi:MAG: citrate synthase [Pseudomonadota bacterium]